MITDEVSLRIMRGLDLSAVTHQSHEDVLGVALRCISMEERKLLDDIQAGECGHHSSSCTLAGKAFRSGFYWPTTL
jgi:hypothetical protein